MDESFFFVCYCVASFFYRYIRFQGKSGEGAGKVSRCTRNLTLSFIRLFFENPTACFLFSTTELQ